MSNLLQREPDFQTQVRTTMLLTTAMAASSETSKACTSAKDVAKHREDVVHVHTGTAEGVEASSGRAESKLVVMLALLRIMQHVVCLCCLLEFLLGFLVAWITVRVIFDGDGAVRLLDLVFGGVFVYAKHLVVVSFLCHYYLFCVLRHCRSINSLLSYCHFGMTYDFIVQQIARLQTVYHLAFLVVAHAGNHRNSLVQVGIEVGILRVHLLDTHTL